MDQLDRFEDKLDKILDTLNNHTVLLGRHSLLHEKNSLDLEHHIRRTDILEEKLKKDIAEGDSQLESQVEEALEPIKALKSLKKFALWLTAIAASITAVITLVKHFWKG